MSGRKYNTRNRRRPKQPDSSYYVGYVEENETVEMIMKKFQEMEKVKERVKAQKKANKQIDSQSLSKKASKAEMSDSDDDDDMNNNNNNKNKDNSDDDALTEEQLAELFKQTSTFSVSSVLKNNEIFMDKPIVSHDGFVTGYEDRYFNSELSLFADYNEIKDDLVYGLWEDEMYGDMDESDFFDDVLTTKKGKKTTKRKKDTTDSGTRIRRRTGRGNLSDVKYDFGSRVEGNIGGGGEDKTKQCWEENYCKIPPHPMPLSWAHPITHYNVILGHTNKNMKLFEKLIAGYKYHLHNDLCKLKPNEFEHNDYDAVLIDAPIDLTNTISQRKGSITLEEYKSLPIGDLMENGMLFIWCPSELIWETITIAEHWGFLYCEHACWVKQTPHNLFACQKNGIFNVAKENLLLFRKANKKLDGYKAKIEFRHQRTSDVHFNFIRYHEKYPNQELKPEEYAYKLIETLLPNATKHLHNNPDKSKLLYLWAPEYSRRRGWTMVVDQKHLQYLQKNENKIKELEKEKENKNNNNKQKSWYLRKGNENVDENKNDDDQVITEST